MIWHVSWCLQCLWSWSCGDEASKCLSALQPAHVKDARCIYDVLPKVSPIGIKWMLRDSEQVSTDRTDCKRLPTLQCLLDLYLLSFYDFLQYASVIMHDSTFVIPLAWLSTKCHSLGVTKCLLTVPSHKRQKNKMKIDYGYFFYGQAFYKNPAVMYGW